MRSLIVSGGGSFGAFTAGRIIAQKQNYDMAIGCSTGSLIAPFALLGKYAILQHAYSNVCNEDIFNVNPFKKNGRLKIFNTLYRLIIGKRTLGETISLRKTISKYFTIDIYNEILASKKDLYVTVCNICKEPYSTEYISIREHDYETFCDYIWASCCVPIVTSIVNINTDEYVDGGTLEGVPLNFAINKGAKEIDVYLHEVEVKSESINYVKNTFHFAMRLFKLMRNELRNDDLRLYNKTDNDTIVNLKYLPYKLDKPILYFDKVVMDNWVNEGYLYEKGLLR